MTLAPRLSLIVLLALSATASAQQAMVYDDAAEIRSAISTAQSQGQAARRRAEALEAEAARATKAVDRTAQEAAGIAARIQQSEAKIAIYESRGRLIASQRRVLRARLAQKQQPLVRLTAALQRLARRPPVLSLLRPGSVRDTMHMRALLDSMLPEVERRTAALRAEITRGQTLQRQAAIAARDLRDSQGEFAKRRQTLAALETRQRLESRTASGLADREAERALALAEQARDLDSLAEDIGASGELRQMLARLPGPVQRPLRPEQSQVVAGGDPSPAPPTGLPAYMLPITGKLVAGFGEAPAGLPRSRGIALAARAGAQAIAPAAGRVAYAGPYRGYGQIIIIEHDGGWTSLVTGLAQLDTRVGASLVAGSPLGITGTGKPIVTLELRRGGNPVNPLEYIRAL